MVIRKSDLSNEDLARENLTKAIKAYREKFDDEEPDFGWGFFPRLHLIPEYIYEIDQAIRENKPIKKTKEFDHLSDANYRTKI